MKENIFLKKRDLEIVGDSGLNRFLILAIRKIGRTIDNVSSSFERRLSDGENAKEEINVGFVVRSSFQQVQNEVENAT